MGQLQTIESDLVDLGYQIIAVSADKPSKIAEFENQNEYRYTLLSDSGLEGAKAFGIAFRVSDGTYNRYKESFGLDLEEHSGEDHHALPVPAVYIVDTQGKILFEYINPNYQVRLHPDILLAAAKAHAEE